MKHQRGFAMLLVLVTVVVATTLACSFLTGQSTATQISRNIESHVQARALAETGLRLALAEIQANANWRQDHTEGEWVSNSSLLGGTITITAVDGEDTDNDGTVEGDGNLADDPDDPLTLIATGKINETTHVARATVTPKPGTPIKVLFAVADADNLTTDEESKKTTLEDWGFVVSTISDNESPATYSSTFSQYDVAYISAEASASQIGTKLATTWLGVITELPDLCDEFGVSDSGSTYTSSSINVVDNTHYICSPFASGSLEILSTPGELNCAGSSLADDAISIAERPMTSRSVLVALEAGGMLRGGGTADGRRVLLPWGGAGFSFSTLNNDGKTILKRAIQWAAQTPPSPEPALHYNFDTQSGTTVIDRKGTVNLLMDNGNGSIDWVNDPEAGTGIYFNQNAQTGTAIAKTENDNTADNLKTALQTSDALTLQVFLKAEGFDNSYGRVLTYSRDTGSTTRNLTLAADNDGAETADFISRVKNAGSATEYMQDNKFSINTFHVLAFTVDHSISSGNIKLYVDGKLISTSSASGSFDNWTSEQFMLGNEKTADRPFRGTLFDVKIWDKPLSPAQLLANAQTMLPAEDEDPQLIALYEFTEEPPPNPVLISHWKLDESTGGGGTTTAIDERTLNDGTYTGDPLGGETGFGDGGTAVRFDGSNDYVLIPHKADYLLNQGAVSLWFNSDTMSGHHGLFSKDSSDFDTGGHLHVYTDGSRVKVRLQSTTTSYELASGSGVSTGQWHHVCVNFGAGGVKLYLDGTLADSDSYTGGLGTNSGGTGNYEPLVLGSCSWGSGDLAHTPLSYYFRGLIDDVRIYNYPLNTDQVSDLYSGGEISPSSGVGTIVKDTCGFGGPLDLTIEDTSKVNWIEGGGLEFTGSTKAESAGSASKLYDALTDTDEMTLEVKFTPANITQNGPARIVSYSSDGSNRNFTFGQNAEQYVQRLRTSSTSANGTPDISSSDVLDDSTIQHVIVTFGDGALKTYRDGNLEVTAERSGSFNWNSTYPFILANEQTKDRPWLGTLYRVAVYDRSLSAGQVNNVFNGNPPGSDTQDAYTYDIEWK